LFIFLSIFLAFFDLSLLRTHFRPLPFLRKILAGMAEKFAGDRRPACAYAQDFRLHSLQRDETA
jgi:hypothetical protein